MLNKFSFKCNSLLYDNEEIDIENPRAFMPIENKILEEIKYIRRYVVHESVFDFSKIVPYPYKGFKPIDLAILLAGDKHILAVDWKDRYMKRTYNLTGVKENLVRLSVFRKIYKSDTKDVCEILDMMKKSIKNSKLL